MTDTPIGLTDNRPDDLPCGRDPLDVTDRARVGHSTEHELTCPYCQAVINDTALQGRAAAALAESEIDTPVPDTLLPTVMRTVWSELRRSTMIPLRIDAGTATAFIADHAVSALIESALDDITDLQVHTCTVTLEPPPTDTSASGPEPGPDVGPRLSVDVTAAAAYVSDVRSLADQARDRVRRTVSDQLGWTVADIDIDIVDVYQHEGPQQ